MNKFLLSLIVISTIALSSYGQAPQAFKYQAVVRDADNKVLMNQEIGMQLRILQNGPDGEAVYTESFTCTSNGNGLVNLEIGKGKTIDEFSAINWAIGSYFIETAVDVSGGTDYVVMGTSQLLSVPYALYAETAGNISGAKNGQGQNPGTGGGGTGGGNPSWGLAGNAGTTNGTDFIGTTDAVALDIRTNNVVKTRITQKGQIETLNTGNSVFIGEGAGASDDLSLNHNVFIGQDAGNANTTGQRNVAIGWESLNSNTEGERNTASGWGALRYNVDGDRNNAFGQYALASNISGYQNCAFGASSLPSNLGGSYNCAFGESSLYYNQNGSYNTALGDRTLPYNQNSYNVAVGSHAMYWNTSGQSNVAVGLGSLMENTTGSWNTSIGDVAGNTNTTGSFNTFLGAYADATQGGLTNATAIGWEAKVGQSNALILGNNADVGIGTSTPARRLHINDAMRLDPIMTAPSNPSEGDIYMDGNTHKLMVYDGTVWQACW